jgi:hypothetical protein
MTTHTRSTRWLSGSRANKHKPIARVGRRSDRRTEASMELARTRPLLIVEGRLWTRRQIAEDPHWGPFATTAARTIWPGKPKHADRAVSITTCFPPLRGGGRPYHPGTGISDHAIPLTSHQRTARYEAQNGHSALTPRQLRRMAKKQLRAVGRGGEPS